MLISSQRYIDDEIVAQKIESEDFTVQVSPAFQIDGMTVQVVMNGHHSLAAAREAGVAPTIEEQDASENDMVCLIEQGRIEDFLVTARIDSDYYDTETGQDIW